MNPLIMSSQRQWYLLTSKPHKDQLAQEELDKQGYEVYRPLAQRLRNRRGKLVKTIESLFPRYLFIRLDTLNDNWAPVRSTKGVGHFVRFGTNPAFIPDNLILTILQQENKLGEKAIDLDRFHAGDIVMPTEGPFRGLQGIFMKYDGDERAVILLEILTKQTRLSISSAKLLAA